MATQAHCAYCFEALAASFERRQPLGLAQIEDLWDQCYNGVDGEDHEEGDEAMGDQQQTSSTRPPAIARLLNRVGGSTNSSSSTLTSTASSSRSSNTTPASSTSSSRTSLATSDKDEACPLFITWNTISASNSKSLRGCIGTFEPQPLEDGLRSYALTSAFEDHRFSPIPKDLLPRLQCCVTLLTNFSKPTKDPMDWTIGTHGIRISFNYHGRRYGATYLPDVAREQGWTKEEAIVSLMRKAGWSGKKTEWRNVSNLEVVRYEGKKVDMNYSEYKDFRDWIAKQGVEAKALN